jgi:hypothetical protein
MLCQGLACLTASCREGKLTRHSIVQHNQHIVARFQFIEDAVVYAEVKRS